MPFLTLSHVTRYTYRQPVSFGEHRIMVRPRESYDQHLIEAELKIDPPPSELRWLQDVFGNSVAIATFTKRARSLTIDSTIMLAHSPAAVQDVDIEDYARDYPFTYASEEMPDLLRSIERQHLDPLRQIDSWAQRFLNPNGKTDTLALLKDLSIGVFNSIKYQAREDEGTQSPIQTLDLLSGSCRDFAVLFVEATRSLGFGARIVSGYIYNPDQHAIGAGTTHAWAEVYVPGAGWITFDPTNRSLGGANLIPVAVTRDIRFAMPVAGSFVGATNAFRSLTVAVDVMQSGCPTPAPAA